MGREWRLSPQACLQFRGSTVARAPPMHQAPQCVEARRVRRCMDGARFRFACRLADARVCHRLRIVCVSPAYRLRIARASPAHHRAASFAQSAGVGSHRPRSDSERCGRGRRITRAPRPFLQRSARNVPQARDRPAVGASAAPSRHSIGASAQHPRRTTAASVPHQCRITAALLPHPRGFIRAL